MSLDITIKERKEFRCPDCGQLVTTQDIGAECSGSQFSRKYDVPKSTVRWRLNNKRDILSGAKMDGDRIT